MLSLVGIEKLNIFLQQGHSARPVFLQYVSRQGRIAIPLTIRFRFHDKRITPLIMSYMNSPMMSFTK